MTTLQSPRLTLSPNTPADSADFMAMVRDPQVMRFLNGGHAVDLADPDPNAPFLMPRGTDTHVWTARRQDRAFVGWFCLRPDSPAAAELGYRLRRSDWGQGLASEGARALIDWGFATAGYDRIYSQTMAVNQASRRVMEKIGLTYARTFHPDAAPIPGSEEGEVEYALTRSQWQALRPRA